MEVVHSVDIHRSRDQFFEESEVGVLLGVGRFGVDEAAAEVDGYVVALEDWGEKFADEIFS